MTRNRTPFSARQEPSRLSPAMLDLDASGALRDQLAAELKGIGSAEEAATWAHRVLGAKGTLVAADAKHIEDAFQAKACGIREGPNVVGRRRKARARASTARTK